MDRRRHLQLHPTLPRAVTLAEVRADLPDIAPPAGFDPYLGRAAVQRLLNRARKPADVYRPWLIYAGAGAPGSLGDLFSAKPETYESEGLFHLAVRVWGRRTAIRYAPAEQTPFSVRRDGSGIDLLCGDEVLEGSCEQLEPEASCVRNLAYFSDGVPRERDVSITINPVQVCPLRCRFCRRQYDHLDKARLRDEPLLNLSAEEISTHLVENYRIDWASGIQVSIVTGSFATFDHLHRFVDRFAEAMARLTEGTFTPARQPHQNVHLLTHLARTAEQMRELRALGAKTLQDTAEIVSDQRRAELMPKANPRNRNLVGKGELSFDDVVAAVRPGIEVFGERHYFVTLMLGLDTLRETRRGLSELRGAGLVHLDHPIYQPFEAPGLGLYSMSAEELIEANLEAAAIFQPVTTSWDPERLGA